MIRRPSSPAVVPEPPSVRAALRNVRRTVEMQLAAPLDARPNARGLSGPIDTVLAATVVALIGFGVVMVFTASAVQATVQYHDPQFFLKRQAVYAALGLAAVWAVSLFDYHRFYKLTYPVLVGVGVLLLLCVVGFGHSGGGAARWLSIGPVHVQPAEMAKVALVIWLAYSLAKKADRVKTFTVGFLPHLIVAGVFMLLCMKQPDFGSAVVLLLLTFTMLFVAGAKVGYILGASILGGVFGAIAIRFREYRYERYLAWLHMDEHRQDLAYQPFQSVMSFGSGGTTGLGIGRGLQTLYLPEAHTDFVAAIVGEELGFLGVAALCAAYLFLVARGVRAALRAPDDFGSFLAFGLSAMFGVQALVNLAVALAILPTKGLTLPFVSFGGSSLLVNCVAAGILLNISRQGAWGPARSASTPALSEDSARERAARGDRVSRPTIVIAGGGTGGHVFPGLAVAEAMRTMADVEVIFCGTERGLESRVVPARGFRLETLHVEPIKGGGVTRAVRGGLVAFQATARALGLVRSLRPCAVLSMGGYASGPVSLAAAILGVPVGVLEPNRMAGLANRILGRVAKRAYVAWEGTDGAFRPATLRRYGVPLRPGFARVPYAPPSSTRPARVLVMGGSQGAAALNERMPAALAALAALGAPVQVLHQAGRDRDIAVRARYAREGVEGATVVAFIDDVARAIADADIVVARAGAVTIAELTAVGRASVLVPFPHAADDHQAKNAEELARSGAAICLRQEVADPRTLAASLGKLLSDDAARVAMADAAGALGRPSAAADVAADLLDLARIVSTGQPSGGAAPAALGSAHRFEAATLRRAG